MLNQTTNLAKFDCLDGRNSLRYVGPKNRLSHRRAAYTKLRAPIQRIADEPDSRFGYRELLKEPDRALNTQAERPVATALASYRLTANGPPHRDE